MPSYPPFFLPILIQYRDQLVDNFPCSVVASRLHIPRQFPYRQVRQENMNVYDTGIDILPPRILD